LKKILERYIEDHKLQELLYKVIDSFSVEQDKGLPLGNLTSQLLVNIYMNEFDQFMKHRIKEKYYIRYADDFVVLSEDKDWLLEILPQMKNFLVERLKLKMHPNKVSIKTYTSGVDFLGWVNFTDHRVLRNTTKRRILNNLQKQIYKTKVTNEDSRQSYLGLISHGNTCRLKNEIIFNLNQ
jgi:RNA-directed DNA polymerase